ncbi:MULTISPECIES: T9SS type A sorting domain-containing protein [unclassified Chryseobacterium]|uniref:T9SS type A sorting domain-containing protein n=1 Tax=unclassified Chryseobacterium TaxID=2593645 RepID=UPI0012FECF11|nr:MULTISPECIES: T9SS type A sorting domain-containing protein [unclassified Chryseobacterium]
MKKKFFILLVSISTYASGQISLTTSGVAYSQNFDSMGTTTTPPADWSAITAGGLLPSGVTILPVVSDGGASSSGGVFNVGTVSATDRALGVLAATNIAAFGARFINNTGSPVTSVTISFTEEQWRTGANSVVENVAFYYSTNATSLLVNSGTWIPVTTLNLTEILSSSNDNIAVDGNLALNKADKTFTITGLNIANGSVLSIKWIDAKETGNNGMYAIDDFSLTPYVDLLGVSDTKDFKSDFIKNTFVENGEIIFGAEVQDIKIFTLTGQIIKTGSVKKGMALDVAELQKGNYIVTGTINNQLVSQKILKD